MKRLHRALAVAAIASACLACRLAGAQSPAAAGGTAGTFSLGSAVESADPAHEALGPAYEAFDPGAALDPSSTVPGEMTVDFTDTGFAAPSDPSRHPLLSRLIGDVKDYYTAPLRWDGEDWAFFGGTIGAIALAHNYDRTVRAHFVHGSGIGGSTSDLQDALPGAALLLGTYLFSSENQSQNGLTVSWAMAEAAGLSFVTAYGMKFIARRERPSQTTDPNHWFASGSSFPSEHATAAFAIGTVFAESGSGGFRWITRVVGYGVAGFTAYQRLKHNAHWLSDVVAGAALGASSAVFVLDRTYGGESSASSFSVVPTDGGLMLAYSKSFP